MEKKIENISDYGLELGQQVEVNNCNIYELWFSKKSKGKKLGNYYIYEEDVINERVKICTTSKNVGKAGKETGWIYIYDLIDLSEFVVGDKVVVNGIITTMADGKGNKILKENTTMYVCWVGDKNDFVNYIGLTTSPQNSVTGYGNNDVVKKYVSNKVIERSEDDRIPKKES